MTAVFRGVGTRPVSRLVLMMMCAASFSMTGPAATSYFDHSQHPSATLTMMITMMALIKGVSLTTFLTMMTMMIRMMALIKVFFNIFDDDIIGKRGILLTRTTMTWTVMMSMTVSIKGVY
jgi:hypothetical protein